MNHVRKPVSDSNFFSYLAHRGKSDIETDDVALKKLSLCFFMVQEHLEQFKKLEGE